MRSAAAPLCLAERLCLSGPSPPMAGYSARREPRKGRASPQDRAADPQVRAEPNVETPGAERSSALGAVTSKPHSFALMRQPVVQRLEFVVEARKFALERSHGLAGLREVALFGKKLEALGYCDRGAGHKISG